MRRILVVITFLIASISAYPAVADDTHKINSVIARVEEVDSKLQVASPTLSSTDLAILYQMIPGAFFGKTNTRETFNQLTAVGQSFDIDTERLTSIADRLASPLTKQMSDNGMQAVPKSVRFARIGTVAFDAVTHESFITGSVDQDTRDAIFLVYFDGPCRISGTLRQGEIEADHNINVTSRGLHWIRAVSITDTHLSLTLADDVEHVVLGISPVHRAAPAGDI